MELKHFQDGALASLQDQIESISEAMAQRVSVSNGELGYRTSVSTSIDVVLGDGSNPDAPRETISLTADESEIIIPDPVLRSDGSLKFEWETYRYSAVGVSKVLFGTEADIRIQMGRGCDPMMRPVLGTCIVPPGFIFGAKPLRCTSHVNLVIDTPFGRVVNREPALMTAMITKIPPIGETFHQEGRVGLYTESGDRVGTKEGTESTLTSILP